MSSHDSTIMGALRNYNRVLSSYEAELADTTSTPTMDKARELLVDCASLRDSLAKDRRIAGEKRAVRGFYERLTAIEQTASRYSPTLLV